MDEKDLPFKNGDLVKFQFGDGEWRYGRVIGYTNTTQTDNPKYFTWAVKLEKKMPGHQWDALVMPGAIFVKVDPLEEIAYVTSKKRR